MWNQNTKFVVLKISVLDNTQRLQGLNGNSHPYLLFLALRVSCWITIIDDISESMATALSGMQKLLEVGTKIVAVGRNYAAHAKELGNAVPKVTQL